LIDCDLITMFNEKFDGEVVISCSLQDEAVEFEGGAESISRAREEISRMVI